MPHPLHLGNRPHPFRRLVTMFCVLRTWLCDMYVCMCTHTHTHTHTQAPVPIPKPRSFSTTPAGGQQIPNGPHPILPGSAPQPHPPVVPPKPQHAKPPPARSTVQARYMPVCMCRSMYVFVSCFLVCFV